VEFHSYIFLGVGVAISVLGFFLKKEARKSAENDSRISELEKLVATNEALDAERWTTCNKLLEDRREDVKTIFSRLEGR
jgi:hypothetical protein